MRGLGGIFFVIGSLLLLNGWYMRYRLAKAFASPARTGHEAAIEANVRHLPIADQQVFGFNADLVIYNYYNLVGLEDVVKRYIISVLFLVF